MNDKEPPLRKMNKLSIKPTSNTSLPDDLLVSCFARVSRLYYPILSLVSKRFRSLLASPELYQTRSFLEHSTESCLYVCLQFPRNPYPNPCWFTLCKKPNQTLTKNKKEKSSGYFLVPIPSPHSPKSVCASVVAIGSSIYSIGGFIGNKASSKVSVLNCRSHTWHQAPNMQVTRRYLTANVIDGVIYVIGRQDYNSSSWIEVFDPKTQIWKSLSSTGHEICSSERIFSTNIDGKICMYGDNNGAAAYDPKDGTFESIEWNMCIGCVWHPHCVIDNVLFCYYDARVFRWYDTKARLWRNLKGLEGIVRKISKRSGVKLADYGGKIAVLWDVNHVSSSGCGNKEIWCAVIEVERRDGDEIWGTLEWLDVVLTVPKVCYFVSVLATKL